MKEMMRLEQVQMEDCEEVRELMEQVYEDESKKWFQNGEGPFIPGYRSIDMQKYHTWDNMYYKIVYGDKIAGVILVSYTGREHIRIDRFYILPEYQGLGLGTSVLQKMEELYPTAQVWTLDTIQQSPRNHHFYEKNGYVVVDQDEEERNYRKEKQLEDAESSEYYDCNMNLNEHNYRRCDMGKVDFFEVGMYDSRFSDMNMCNNIYANSGMMNSRFTNVNMENSIFADGRLNGVEICHVFMQNANLHDINQDDIQADCNMKVERCNLKKSEIRDCDLQNVKIESCKMDGMTIDGIKVSDLLKAYQKVHQKED